uniref:Putative microtubule-associated protein futsch n=1 Tax=Davidia involucrata TaxID=16924 RepID=A0A5B7AIQ3_DAVIN
MPPSPAMRCSPGRELRDNHKRGRSLEGGILFREKDDDLVLFNEMQTRERDSFLLKSNDDFEDTFSTKLRYFSDYKLGISIPVRGESSDLLNANGEKNDYDWLLTPPDTPLFHSLDDETPPVNFAQRGRPRSQPISISRSSTMEKSYRSNRGSASPNRSSPSPRSGSSMLQSRGRPSSTPHSSPTPSLRHVTPSRRPSPPPSKPSTPAPRSSTPTPRRMSTGSSGTVVSSGVRGTSPVKTSRGNSASPKIRAWQSNIPGFSLDAPPNLRTSLADRPASYVRGSSPVARNGRDPSSKSGRQSMSPTACRSVSSSYSHDRDRFSSHSKGSVASSGDDDVDSLQSIPMGSSDRSASRRVGAVSNNRALAFSKKPTRTTPSSSAPKRSFDSALRQMDHRKGPHNMFRPLLSSVPSSTFYAGKATAAHRALISRNSSVTTSSNASSDQGTSGAHDTEGSDQNQDDTVSECGKAPCTDVQDDVFVFDKVDAVNEDVGHGIHDGSPNIRHGEFNGGPTVDSQLDGSENFSHHGSSMEIIATSEALDVSGDVSEVNSLEDMVLCSKCSRRYRAIESTEGDLKLCPDCRKPDVSLTLTTPVTAIIVAENSPSLSMKISEAYESIDPLQPLMAVPESPEVTDMGETKVVQHEVKASQTSYDEQHEKSLTENSHARSLVEEGDQRLSNQQLIGQSTIGYSLPDGDIGSPQMQHFSDYPNLKADVLEGAGISILLKRSSSGKGPVVRSRSFTASCIPYDDPSYVRDSANSVRSSVGQGSVSASSSVNLVSARQTEIRVHRQLSGKKSDMENYRYDMNTKHRRTGSSLSGTSSHTFQALGLATSKHEETFEVSVAHVENDAVDLAFVAPQEQLVASENTKVDETYTEVDCNNNCRTMVVSASELSSHTLNIHLGDSSAASLSNFKDSASYGNSDDFPNNARSISDMELSAVTPESSTVEENTMSTSSVDRVDVTEVPTQSSLDTISEIEIENGLPDSPGSQSDVSPHSRSTIDELQEPFVPTASDKDITASAAESDTSDHENGIPEESTIMVEGQEGSKARSPTLEEATDTILFCSSIIHNLAYEAASIAMEKENLVPLEGSRPMVTILGKSNSDRKDLRGRTAGKRASKSQKARQRRLETDMKPPSSNIESDEKSEVSTTRMVGVPNKGDNMKPTKLESKCNCTVM